MRILFLIFWPTSFSTPNQCIRRAPFLLASESVECVNKICLFLPFFPGRWCFYMKVRLHICLQLCGDLALAKNAFIKNQEWTFFFSVVVRTICGIHSVYLIKNIVAHCDSHFRLVWHGLQQRTFEALMNIRRKQKRKKKENIIREHWETENRENSEHSAKKELYI